MKCGGVSGRFMDASMEGAKMGPRICEDKGGDGRFANRPYREPVGEKGIATITRFFVATLLRMTGGGAWLRSE